MAVSKKTSKVFYGWVIVICGAIMLGVTHGVISNCFSIFIIPVTESLGISRQAFSICLTIISILYALIAFSSGKIFSHLPIKTAMRVASIILPVSYAAYALCKSITAFYICAFCAGISVAFLTFIPFSIILANWFDEKRGTAIGLCFMGSGLGGMIMNAISTLLIETHGWRCAYWIVAIIMFIIIVPIVWLVIRVTPEEMGLKPLGRPEESQIVYGKRISEAVHTVNFVVLAFVSIITGFVTNILNSCIAPILCDAGYTAVYAGAVVSAYMGGLALAKVVLGSTMDKIGARKGMIMSMAASAVGFAGFLSGRFQPAHLLIIAGALGTASSNVAFPVLTRFAFGTKDFATINGILLGLTNISASFSIMLANSSYDKFGTYAYINIVCIVLSISAMFIMLFVKEQKAESPAK